MIDRGATPESSPSPSETGQRGREGRQLARLRELVSAIGGRNPFYTERLQAAGIDATVASLDEFRERMPFTTKAELARDQEEHGPYGTNLTFPLAEYTRVHQTSSTSGRRPLRWLDTAESWSSMLDGWAEVLASAGAAPGDRVLVAFSFGPFIGLWMAFEAAARMECLAIPGGGMSSTTRLAVMLANDVTILCCTPTYAIRLGEVARDEGVNIESRVRAIVVGGEPGGSVPAARERMESLWPSARVFDHYGMTEVGPVTYQCAERTDAVHVLDDAFLVEVVDPATGGPHPVDADEPGELVLTTLGRTGSPMLRYRTGDLVRPLPRSVCACGRTTTMFAGGIIGRADDMVFVRGVNLYPSAVDQLVRGVEGIAEYRVEIDTDAALTELSIVVEPEPSCADADGVCRSVEQAFRRTYNLRIPVAAVSPGELPRFELKSRRWIKHSKSTP